MKHLNIITIGLAVLLLLVSQVGLTDSGKKNAAQQAALLWLSLVDAKRYQASWETAATLFKQQVDTKAWESAITSVRKPLGNIVTRELISATYATSLPGAPDGEYVVLQYRSKFTNKAEAVETITPMLDEGEWRVSGYYLR